MKKMVNAFEPLPEHPENGVFLFTTSVTRFLRMPLNRSLKVLHVKKKIYRVTSVVEIEKTILLVV